MFYLNLLTLKQTFDQNFRQSLFVEWSQALKQLKQSEHVQTWTASAFLVTVPVFFQAPLVRQAPWLSLILTVGWLAIAQHFLTDSEPENPSPGSLIWGFSLTWICGSIYWGWLRSQPLWHLPIEAIALPWAIWAIRTANSKYLIGAWFYTGSLLGTAVTDLYFYLANLFPHWTAIIKQENDPVAVQSIFQDAVSQVQTPWGMSLAVCIATVICLIGFKAMRSPDLHFWAFAGALLSTILVDIIFAISACLI